MAAIAFGVLVVPVDGNVERVAARLFAIEAPLPASRSAIAAVPQASATMPPHEPGRPTSRRRCSTLCHYLHPQPGLRSLPAGAGLRGRRMGAPETLPRKSARKPRPVRHGALFWLTDRHGQVLLRRRPERGLLGGMTELPGTPWRAEHWQPEEAVRLGPMPASWRHAGRVNHVFTHFELRLDVFAARVEAITAEGFLRDISGLATEALPSVMRKGISVAQGTLS